MKYENKKMEAVDSSFKSQCSEHRCLWTDPRSLLRSLHRSWSYSTRSGTVERVGVRKRWGGGGFQMSITIPGFQWYLIDIHLAYLTNEAKISAHILHHPSKPWVRIPFCRTGHCPMLILSRNYCSPACKAPHHIQTFPFEHFARQIRWSEFCPLYTKIKICDPLV